MYLCWLEMRERFADYALEITFWYESLSYNIKRTPKSFIVCNMDHRKIHSTKIFCLSITTLITFSAIIVGCIVIYIYELYWTFLILLKCFTEYPKKWKKRQLNWFIAIVMRDITWKISWKVTWIGMNENELAND